MPLNHNSSHILRAFLMQLTLTQVYNGQPLPLGLNVKVEDQEGVPVLERSFPPGDGRFAFTSQVGAEHKICFSTNSSRWFGPAVRTVSISS